MNPPPRTVTVTVDAEGEATVATAGFAGAACRAASRPIEHALGLATSDVPTPEMARAAAVEAAGPRRTVPLEGPGAGP